MKSKFNIKSINILLSMALFGTLQYSVSQAQPLAQHWLDKQANQSIAPIALKNQSNDPEDETLTASATLIKYTHDTAAHEETVSTYSGSFNQNHELLTGTEVSADGSSTVNIYTGWQRQKADAKGDTQTMSYDGLGRVIQSEVYSKVAGIHNIQTMQYIKQSPHNRYNQMISTNETQENGVTSESTYQKEVDLDGLGREVQEKDNFYDGTTHKDAITHLLSTIHYNLQGLKDKTTAINGMETDYYYDPEGRNNEVDHLAADGKTGLYRDIIAYDDIAKQVKTYSESFDGTVQTGLTVSNQDTQGSVTNEISYADPASKGAFFDNTLKMESTTTYDNWEQKQSDLNTDEAGKVANSLSYRYNSMGLQSGVDIKSANNTIVNQILYHYDMANHVTGTTFIPAGEAEVNRFHVLFDAEGRMLKETIPGAKFSKTHRYDAYGNDVADTDLGSDTTTVTHDYINIAGEEKIQKTSIPQPDGTTRNVHVDYSQFLMNGLLKTFYDANDPQGADEVDTIHNANGEPTQITYVKEGKSLRYEYNNDGAVVREIDAEGLVTENQYDSITKLPTKTILWQPTQGTTDTDCQRSTDCKPLAQIDYVAYDKFLRPLSIKHSYYDDAGQQKTIDTTNQTYDNFGQVLSIERSENDGVGVTKNTINYEYEAGKIKRETVAYQTDDGVSNFYHTDYTYEEGTHYLQTSTRTEDTPDGSTNTSVTKTYSYNGDATSGNNGNITQITISGSDIGVNGIGLRDTIKKDYSYNQIDQLQAANISYDVNGNMTHDASNHTLTFDGQNQLVAYADDTGKVPTYHYTYRPNGQRETQSQEASAENAATTIRYFYDANGGLQNEEEVQNSADDKRAYAGVSSAYFGNMRFLLKNNTVISRQVFNSDVKGSVLSSQTIDAQGVHSDVYRYDDNGAQDTVHSTVKTNNTLTIATNPMQYGSQLTDASGLAFRNARYFDPTTGPGIFISFDSAQLANRYANCSGDPINFSDPSGHSAISDFGNMLKTTFTGIKQEVQAGNLWGIASMIFAVGGIVASVVCPFIGGVAVAAVDASVQPLLEVAAEAEGVAAEAEGEAEGAAASANPTFGDVAKAIGSAVGKGARSFFGNTKIMSFASNVGSIVAQKAEDGANGFDPDLSLGGWLSMVTNLAAGSAIDIGSAAMAGEAADAVAEESQSVTGRYLSRKVKSIQTALSGSVPKCGGNIITSVLRVIGETIAGGVYGATISYGVSQIFYGNNDQTTGRNVFFGFIVGMAQGAKYGVGRLVGYARGAQAGATTATYSLRNAFNKLGNLGSLAMTALFIVPMITPFIQGKNNGGN